jgi:c-di-GMP-binding flagellar brake protein YcgR
MSDSSSFSIHNQRQIISNLVLLLKNKCLIRARFGENNESYITTLLGINAENNTIFLDYGPKDYINSKIVNADRVTFETEYKGIKVSFIGGALKKVTNKGEPLFSMPIPKTLFWMERREYHRVKIPVSKPSYCQLILQDREPINFQLHDLSLSGFSILCNQEENFNQMVLGTIFEQCKLVLFEAGEYVVSFEIRYNHIINPEKPQKTIKNGCKFIDPSHVAENAIQSYMQKIQREDLQDVTTKQEDIYCHKKIITYIVDR